MLKNTLHAFAIAVAVSALGLLNPSLAHEGHNHGDEVVPSGSLPIAPRATATSDDFEVVAAAADGRLIIYIDRFATNEPIAGATVEIVENDVTAPAAETAAGVYTISGWARPPGAYNLMVAVDTGDISDLLPVTLEIPLPIAPASTGYPTFWVVIGQTASIAALALVLMVIYLRTTRRYDYVLDSGVRLSETALLLSTTVPQAIESVHTRRLGPMLITDRLWDETGCADVIREAAGRKPFGFPVERVLYATVLQRMFDNEPNRPLREWLDEHVVGGTADIVDRHLGIAIEWLGREAEPVEGHAASGRTTKDVLEEKLFSKRVDTEAGLDLVFFNSLPVPITVRSSGRNGKKGPAHPPAMAVGVVLDAAGHPICFELWPGGTMDVEALLPAIDRLRARFDIRRVCLVSDLGITKPATIDAFNERGIQFILGLRDSETALRSRLLGNRRPLESISLPDGTSERIEIAIKEVEPDDAWTPGRERFIVCSETPSREPRTNGASRTEVEETESEGGGVEGAARRNPEHYVLRTNTDLPPAEIVGRYRQLLVVEETFRAAKAILDMQTIPSVGEAIVRGHMFCSFLALLLRREIEVKLAASGLSMDWRDVVRDLNRLTETEVAQAGRRFVIRSEPSGNALMIAEALGVALPPSIERRADEDTPTALGTRALPIRLRSEAVRVGSVAVAGVERKVRAVGDWLGRQN